jgi:quinol monooxygenase YgiN
MNCLNRQRVSLLLTFFFLATLVSTKQLKAQDRNPNIRVARLVIDPSKLAAYKAALSKEIDASIKIEPGVLVLYAVYDKKETTHVTVFEIYADEEAYKSHIQTPHFKKYKEAVADMVKSLELTEMSPITLGSKSGSPVKQ